MKLSIIGRGSVGSMIAMHYMAGSPFDTEFWNYATDIGEDNFLKNAENKTQFYDMVKNVCTNFHLEMQDDNFREIGSWWPYSYKHNIEKLGLSDKIGSIVGIYG